MTYAIVRDGRVLTGKYNWSDKWERALQFKRKWKADVLAWVVGGKVWTFNLCGE